MFEQSLLESSAVARSHRTLATSLSALAQLTLLTVAIVLPMVFTQTLPLKLHVVEPIMPPHPVPPPEPQPAERNSDQGTLASGARAIVVNNIFPAVRSFASTHEVAEPQIPQAYGATNTNITDLLIGNPTASNLRGPGRPLMISNLSEGRIIRRVTPVYPALAKRVGIQGQVILEAVISRNGRIENLRVISGHPTLISAATDAVSQWQFRPYILNGTPVEVVTQITVDFKLTRD